MTSKILISFLLLFSGINSTKELVKTFVAEDIDYLVDFYKERHQNPEVSLQEEETAARLAEELRKVGFEVTENFGGYGIVGILKNGDGPTILYRTDMDALPMYEKTDLPYASEKTINWNGSEVGTMHSCGHDMHMTTWLGTARAMAKMKDKWRGTLMLIGQPAEEIGAGARMMLNEGLYERFGVPDMGFGLHSNPTIEAGKIGVADGYTMATAEIMDIKVKGVGAHGASPHMSVDPIVLSSLIVMELQTIVSRNVKPIDDAVVTVGSIKGGSKGNIIPDEVTMELTLRTYTEEVRQLVHRRIEEICKGIAISAGLPEDKWPEVNFPDEFTPANYNDPELTARFKSIATGVLGSENVVYAEPQMVGEDFSMYGQTKEDVPTVLFWLGTVTKEKIEKGDLPGLHSPFYYPEPAKSIETGVEVMTNVLVQSFSK
jgi:hippurate hydrolase